MSELPVKNGRYLPLMLQEVSDSVISMHNCPAWRHRTIFLKPEAAPIKQRIVSRRRPRKGAAPGCDGANLPSLFTGTARRGQRCFAPVDLVQFAQYRDELPGDVAPVVFIKGAARPRCRHFAFDMLADEKGKADFRAVLIKANETGNRDPPARHRLERMDLRQNRIGSTKPVRRADTKNQRAVGRR